MSPTSQKYTLVGFSPELDWRPLSFVKPIPPNKVCSACGLVPKMIALLPCMHALCDPCYDQCRQGDVHVCPLDGYECEQDDTEWKDFRADELLKREVKCWNEKSGCKYLTVASGIVQHFHHECGYHSVFCPKCSATVPCSGVVEHLKSGLCDQTALLCSETEKSCEKSSDAELPKSSEETIEKHASEIRELLGRIEGEISTHGHQLNEISQAINTLKETQKPEGCALQGQLQQNMAKLLYQVTTSNEKLDACTRRMNTLNLAGTLGSVGESLKEERSLAALRIPGDVLEIRRAIQEVKAESNRATRNSGQALDHIKRVLQYTKLNVALCMFFVNNVKELKRTALDAGSAMFESAPVYLRGYCISPGVQLVRQDGSVRLFATLRLHKGEMDDIVSWPFEHDIILKVLHPKDLENRELEVKTWRSAKSFQRPTSQPRDASVCIIRADSLNFNQLIREGYVEDDKIRVKLELLK